MKVVFLGVGEAFDEDNLNNSHLIFSKTKLLLDCGFTVPFQLWKYNADQLFLDIVFISHCHADHYFGLPVLLLRMWEEKRTKKFTIICQKGKKKIIEEMIEYGYKGFREKFEFKIEFIEVEAGQTISFNELKLSFESTMHSTDNLAIKVSDDKNAICYSGDGMFTKKTESLYANSDLLIQEVYLFDEKKIGHACIVDTVEMAKRNKIKCLALTHLNRFFRKRDLEKIKEFISKEKIKIIIPKPLEKCSF